MNPSASHQRWSQGVALGVAAAKPPFRYNSGTQCVWISVCHFGNFPPNLFLGPALRGPTVGCSIHSNHPPLPADSESLQRPCSRARHSVALAGKALPQPGVWSKSLQQPGIPPVICPMSKYNDIHGFQAGVPSPQGSTVGELEKTILSVLKAQRKACIYPVKAAGSCTVCLSVWLSQCQ